MSTEVPAISIQGGYLTVQPYYPLLEKIIVDAEYHLEHQFVEPINVLLMNK